MRILAFASALLCSSLAFSAPSAPRNLPLLKKISLSGYVMFEDVKTRSCDIYENRVVITHEVAGIRAVETKAFQMDARSLKNLRDKIALASRAPIESNEAIIADAPENWWKAYYNGREVVLKGEADFSPEFWIQRNTSLEARTLSNLLDSLCN